VVLHPDRIEQVGPMTPPPEPREAMIYDRERAHVERRTLGKGDLKLMGDEPRIFREAKWTGRRWKLGSRVVSQQW
jgi:hypothetical protein